MTRRLPHPRPQLVFAIFVILVAGCAALIVFFGLAQQARIDTAVQLADYRKTLIAEQQAAYNSLLVEYQQVTNDCSDAADCETTATPPSLIPDSDEISEGVPGATGSPGAPGPRGPEGASGRAPSATELFTAVEIYCASRDGCQGPPGVAGRDGQPGANSTVPGPQGPAGADSTTPGPQGEAGTPGAVGPAGPTGPAGPPGAPGVDGRGIAAIECQPDGAWAITYTDGTVSFTPGPCRIPDPTPPTPEPEVPTP